MADDKTAGEKRRVRRIQVVKDCEYNPPDTITWFRKFKEGWSGPVPAAIAETLVKRGDAADIDPVEADGARNKGAPAK